MSLFKARDWWSTRVGDDEVFDLGCFAVGNIDNASTPSDKIVVGSFHGILRIYKPQRHEDDGAQFSPQDLLCEIQLSQPILQVELGRFVSGSDGLHIAVLHSRKLSVYSLTVTSGQVEHGIQYQLKMVNEHDLDRTSCNMCYGPFGGVKGRDFICVQSMDGALSIYEQESFAFTRFLPRALIPGPIRYVSKTDSFVTVSSCRNVESYKYKVLAVATDVKTKEEAENVKSGKKVVSEWELNIGEQAIDIVVTHFENAPLFLYILGERNLYIVTENGKLRHMKKFDFNPSCFLPYGSVAEKSINCMIATHTNQLFIYKNVKLQWAAQLPHMPVHIRVANFRELKGAIVTLSEDGRLSCLYLGTDPAMFTTPTSEVRELDYDDLNAEMENLQKVIREQQRKAAIDLPAAKEEQEIRVTIEIPPDLDESSHADDCEYEEELPVPSITAKLSVQASKAVRDVRVSIHVPAPLYSSEKLIAFSELQPDHPAEWHVIFYKRDGGLVPSLGGEVTATYLGVTGAPRVVYSTFRLPLKLACTPVVPNKSATYKVTIDTNKPPVSLNDIYPDMLGDSLGGPGNALGFRYFGTQDLITVLASKTSQRYRLQCDCFENLWLMLDETARRLTVYMRTHGITSFKISYDGQLPLQEFFDVLDAHFICRSEEASMRKMLEERAVQFRAIQRRLLTRFKDKTPVPLANLDTLLNGTYTQLMQIATDMEGNIARQQALSRALAAAVQILIFMIKVWQDMNDTEFLILQATFAPKVENNSQLDAVLIEGWEEMVDASITHLLRTCLAKSAKDQTVNPTPLTLLKDTQKLKKHIALLCDRISKGAKLHVEGMEQPPPEDETTHPMISKNKRSSHTSLGKAPSIEEFNRKGSKSNTLPTPGVGEFGGSHKSLDSDSGHKRGHLAGDIQALLGMESRLEDHDDSDHIVTSPVLGEEGGGNRFLKKESSEVMSPAKALVPDLDDMGGEESDPLHGANTASGTGELVGMIEDLAP